MSRCSSHLVTARCFWGGTLRAPRALLSAIAVDIRQTLSTEVGSQVALNKSSRVAHPGFGPRAGARAIA